MCKVQLYLYKPPLKWAYTSVDHFPSQIEMNSLQEIFYFQERKDCPVLSVVDTKVLQLCMSIPYDKEQDS